MGKRSVSAGLVAALVAGFVALAAPPASALTDVEACFSSSINRERAAVGRAALRIADDLVQIARRHSAEMAAEQRIWHNDDLPNEVRGDWRLLGENVGMGPSCESLHNAFMDSPGHRANILESRYNQLGIGVAIRDGTIYVTEVFADRRPTTTVRRSTAPARRPAARAALRPPARRPAARAARPAAAPAPAAAPTAPPPPPPRTVTVLVQLIGLDSPRVDPVTGAAMGV
jgi:hypothetical protein